MTPSTALISVELIDPNPQQPRTEFDPDALQELANSIAEHGLIQPIVVSRLLPNSLPDKGGPGGVGAAAQRYILTAGERRLRAAKLAGLTEIPVLIEGDFDDSPTATADRRQRAVVENLQRQDMNAVEIAESLQAMKDDDGLSDEQIGQKIGKGRAWVANKRALLALPEVVRQAVSTGAVSERTAMRLLPATKIKPHQMEGAGLTNQPDFSTTYGDPPTPNTLFKRVAVKNDLTSDQVDTIIKRMQERIEQANRVETRHCRFCGAPRQFTGRELTAVTVLSPTCADCGKQLPASRWLTALESAEVQARTEAEPVAEPAAAPIPNPPLILASAPLMADRHQTALDRQHEQAKPLAQTVSAQKPDLLAGLKKKSSPAHPELVEGEDELDEEPIPNSPLPSASVSANGKKNGGSAPPASPPDKGGAEAIINIRLSSDGGVLRYTLSAAKAGQFPALHSGVALELPVMVQRFIEEFTPSTVQLQEAN